MIKVSISGYCGKMGRTIALLAFDDKEIEVCGALEREDHPLLGKDIGEIIGRERVGIHLKEKAEEVIRISDVLIEFSTSQATLEHIRVAKECRKAMVIGTTGFTPAESKEIREAGEVIPIFISPNMSRGVNLLFRLIEETAKYLGKEYRVEISEFHHRFKKDAPSGTAKRLAQIVKEAGNREEVGMHSLRGGDVVGEHTVVFVTDGERLELTHKAHSRKAFAQGAIAAAKFIAKKDKGVYNKLNF
ncbi:MAG: 4-hydroxy-tetrahydrodipicolinate reductase [Candidatus Omnitrophota bacterium]|nr:MAG: 4-hydroxy-tetrahydrodipicolinate reductase [Candidatus Omnitrophota bacterium]